MKTNNKTKRIKDLFLKSSFLKALKVMKKSPNVFFYTIVLDFIFLALIIFVGEYFGSLVPSVQQLMGSFKTMTNLLIFIFLYLIIYYLFVVFVYSVSQLSILNLIKSLYEKNKFSLKRLGRFYLLNLLILIILFSIALFLLVILSLVLTPDFLKYLILILFVPFLFFSYSIIKISHILFIKNKNEKKGIIKKSFGITFTKIHKYWVFIVWDCCFVLIYLLIYNIVHLIFKSFIFVNKGMITSYGNVYLQSFNVISLIVFCVIIAFNRIYFYERIGNEN